jgi:hypothetical protein
MSTVPRARWLVKERSDVGMMMASEEPTDRCMRTASSTPSRPNT